MESQCKELAVDPVAFPTMNNFFLNREMPFASEVGNREVTSESDNKCFESPGAFPDIAVDIEAREREF